jgi:hypothetical protein
MKTLKQFGIVLTIALSTLLSSCSSDSDGGGGGFSGPATGTFVKAKVAGSNLLAEGSYANGGYNGGNLVLQGFSLTGQSVNIQLYALDGALEVGTYNMSTTNTEDAYVGSLSLIDINMTTLTSATYSSLICNNTSGTVEITFVDATKIEGTFSFTGIEVREGEDCSGGTKNVTNGSFRLEL